MRKAAAITLALLVARCGRGGRVPAWPPLRWSSADGKAPSLASLAFPSCPRAATHGSLLPSAAQLPNLVSSTLTLHVQGATVAVSPGAVATPCRSVRLSALPCSPAQCCTGKRQRPPPPLALWHQRRPDQRPERHRRPCQSAPDHTRQQGVRQHMPVMPHRAGLHEGLSQDRAPVRVGEQGPQGEGAVGPKTEGGRLLCHAPHGTAWSSRWPMTYVCHLLGSPCSTTRAPAAPPVSGKGGGGSWIAWPHKWLHHA